MNMVVHQVISILVSLQHSVFLGENFVLVPIVGHTGHLLFPMHSSILIMVYYDILSNLQFIFSCHHFPFYGFLHHQYLHNLEYFHFMVKPAGDSCSSSLGLIQRSICRPSEPIGFHTYIAGGILFGSSLCQQFPLISCYICFHLSSMHSTRCGIVQQRIFHSFSQDLLVVSVRHWSDNENK